jgi:hypothetical protein
VAAFYALSFSSLTSKGEHPAPAGSISGAFEMRFNRVRTWVFLHQSLDNAVSWVLPNNDLRAAAFFETVEF